MTDRLRLLADIVPEMKDAVAGREEETGKEIEPNSVQGQGQVPDQGRNNVMNSVE
jgi:hypothetical protein